MNMAFSSVDALDVPPYQLQQLIPLVFDNEVPDSGFGTGRTSRTETSNPGVTCAQATGSEIYIGCSDGTLLRYALQANSQGSPESYTLLSRQTLPTNKAVDEIALLPSISRALILSDHQIHFYVIPSLDPLPSQIIRPIRNVVSFAVDEQAMRLPSASASDPYSNQSVKAVEFCVIKRTAIHLYSLKERLVLQRELPNAQGLRYARRNGRHLCAADGEFYNMVDLVAAASFGLLPIEQVPDEDQAAPSYKPGIAVVNETEFLLLSCMGRTTMGVFVTGNGDPVRGTLEWPSHPESVCVDFPHVAALLPNKTIEIHSLETQAIVQVVSPSIYSPTTSSPTPPNGSDLQSLITCFSGFLVPSTHRTEKLKLVPITLTPEQSDEPSGSGLTPPLRPSKSIARPPLFPRSNALVLSSNSISALLPSTLISQAEALLESHRLEDAADLADQNQRKLLASRGGTDEDLSEEVHYVYQRVGFRCLEETLFEDAGRHLLAGELDPRLLVRFFPDLRGDLLKTTPVIDMFAGVAEHLPKEDSIEEIVVANIVRNYSPHMQPDTRTAPPTAELRRVLCATARDMLASYLRKIRTRRLLHGLSNTPQNTSVNAVIDTVLVKILAESEDTADLYSLIDGPSEIVLTEVEEPLAKNGQYNALCKLYARAGDEDKLLEAWSKIADGVWTDEDVRDPLSNMVDLLKKTTNRSLIQRWGLWLTAKDADLGLKLLISRDSKRTSKADELALLKEIKAANPLAGTKYLEYLVLQKRNQDPSLHDQLADVYVDQLTECAADETTSKLWRAKASSYASSPNDSPFFSYFASTTPQSNSRDIRLKTALFLQGSSLYDAEHILERIQEYRKILRLELALLSGKLGRHEEAISTLVHEIHDHSTAEAYCTLGGDVIPSKVAWSIGERCGLQRWASLVSGVAPGLGMGSTAGSKMSTASIRTKVTDENTKRELLKVLLRVYMSGGESTMNRTARLLNAQAVNLDVVDVIQLVPPDWPVSAMSSFLTRSFRRTLHASHEGQIIKAISSGQNLEVVENAWLALRDQGAVIEEPLEDDDGEGGEKVFDEKLALLEPSNVVEIRMNERKSVTDSPDNDLRTEGVR